MFRVGLGFDVHRLVEGRALWLGGVNIPWERGLLGHSDADVAIHALCDALLGAAALRDIGYHFPDSDPQYKGIDSRLLLRHVMRLLDENGYRLGNCDILTFPPCSANWLRAWTVNPDKCPSRPPRPRNWAIPVVARALPPMLLH